MSQWGVFHDDGNQVHVAPCLPDGRLPVNHSLHEFCQCGPKVERTNKMDADGYRLEIYVHQDKELGGANA
jgi:hypothetical protein